MLSNLIKDIPGLNLKENCDLTNFSTLRLKSMGDIIFVSSKKSLQFLLLKLKKHDIPYRILGWGANQILPERGRSVFIKLKFPFDKENYLSKMRDEYDLPASVSLNTLSSHAIIYGIKGWEVFTGIPASLGGAIYMNAGTELGEIREVLKTVTIIDSGGKEKVITIDYNSFSYRKNHFVKKGDVIVSAKLIHQGYSESISKKIRQYLKKRGRTQPLNKFTCGCVFKNASQSCRAGKYIDIIGFKGLCFKNIMVSKKHANFFENRGISTAEDVKRFINYIKYEIELNFGIKFETEVQI